MSQLPKFTDKFHLHPLVVAMAVATTLTSLSSFAADEADIQKAIDYVKKHEKDGVVKPNGLGLSSADGENSINLTGMVHFDAHVIRSGLPRITDKDSASAADAFEFRRVRLGVNGTVFKDVDYEVIVNATGTDTNILDTGYLNFSAVKEAQVRVGRFRQPYSLEAMTKDNAIDFMERSYGDQLGPNKMLGVGLFGEPRKGLTYGLAVAQAGFNEITNTDNIGGFGTGRATLNFGELNNLDGQVIHLGASANRGKYESTPATSTDTGNSLIALDTAGAVKQSTSRATLLTYRTEDRGLANAYRVQLGGDFVGAGYGVLANNAAQVEKTLNDLEFAYATGPFKFQAEVSSLILNANVLNYVTIGTATGAKNASLQVTSDTKYAEFVYNLTGERWSDGYKGGAFSFLKPNSNFHWGEGGTGAWQIGVRVSEYKASVPGTGSAITDGGNNKSRAENSESARTITYGLNWLLNPSTAVKFNYAATKFDRPVYILSTAPASATTNTENVFSVRAQINF